MAVAVVSGTIRTVSGSETAAAAHTAGNTLVVFAQDQTDNTITISDTAGNTYSAVGEFDNGTNRGRIFKSVNITGHASNVVTAFGLGTFPAVAVIEISGLGSTPNQSFVGTGSAVSGNSATLNAGTPTLTETDAVLLGFYEGDSNSFTAGSGWTGAVIGTAGFMFYQYKLVSVAEAIQCTQSPSNPWYGVGVSLDVAGGGGGSTGPGWYGAGAW